MAELHSAPSLMNRITWALGTSIYAAILSASVSYIVFWIIYAGLASTTDVVQRSVGYFGLLVFYLVPAALLMTLMSFSAQLMKSDKALDWAILGSVAIWFAVLLTPVVFSDSRSRSGGLVEFGEYAVATMVPSAVMGFFHRELLRIICRRVGQYSHFYALIPDSAVEVIAISSFIFYLMWLQFDFGYSVAICFVVAAGLFTFLLAKRKKLRRSKA